MFLRQNPRASLVAVLAWLKKKGPKTGENGRAAQDDDEEAAASSSSIRRLCDYVATTIAPCWTPKGEGDEEGMFRVCLLFFWLAFGPKIPLPNRKKKRRENRLDYISIKQQARARHHG